MRRWVTWIVALGLSIPGVAYLATQKENPLRAVELAMGDRAYSDAVGLLEAEVAKSPANEDELLLKLSGAYELAGQPDKALGALDRLLEKHPNSAWARKAHFRRGQVLAARKQWEQAQSVAGTQVRYLVGNDRKLELAGVYLKYAEESFRPKDRERKPDYEKARVFFEKALDLGLVGEKAEEIRYRIGQCHFELGQFDQAVARLDTFTKDHPKSKWAPAALYQLGLARHRRGEAVRARIHFRDLLADYTDTTQAAEAAYEIAKTYGVPGPPSDESLAQGVKALREFVEKHPDHAKAMQADFEIAQSYNSRGRADEAIAQLRGFIQKRAQSRDDLLPEAKILLGEILRGQKKYDEAIQTWMDYLKAHPTHHRWDSMQRSVIDTRFHVAQELLSQKKYDPAQAALVDFLLQYPIDSRAPQAAFLLGEIEHKRGEYNKAIEQWEKVASKYKGAEWGHRARFEIAQTYERNLQDLTKAYEAYRKSAEEDKFGPGQQRFAQIKQKHLAVVIERAFRTDEKPALRLTARNIEKLQFAAYRINMETYFRRHYRFGGIEGLDITLIEPDKRWEYTFPKYEKYRLYEEQVALPLEGPGVWAIHVTDEKLEATAQFVITDLAAVTKATRKEVFVFVQNVRTGKPHEGAAVLVSDAAKILVSGKTGKDGVFHEKVKELKDAGQARFFVMDGAHYAATDADVGQLAYVEELQSKAYIFTDKPAYRPGQAVHVAAIVRDVGEGQYRIPEVTSYTCDLVGARGDLVERRAVTLDEFGMVHADFVLGESVALGEYRINLSREKAPPFSNMFRVERYKLENIELRVDVPQTVYLRGDTVKGKIVARYYYGEPVVDHQVVYEVPGFFIREGRTDAKGEVAFEFPTREFVESQALQLTARLPEDNVGAAKAIWIATRALNLAVSTTRDVYLAGEKFDVVVKGTDLGGEKTTASAQVRVVKLEVVDGKETEKETAAHSVSFGADKGEGRVAVQVGDGGHYILRAEGKDRFGTGVSGQKRVFVSGDQDEVMLRILSDRQEYKVGEKAEVNVVCRTTETVLGVVTYEADGVLGYEIRELKKGENAHAFRMQDAHAPNMVLAVAAVWRNRFFEAEKDFTVTKGLTIELKPDKETYEPAQTVRVRVKAYDQEGKPARAQVVLALVDQALYALYGETAPDIREFFYGARRGRAVRTGTSATFRHAPATRTVIAALRDEEERVREVAGAEGVSRTTRGAAFGVPLAALEPGGPAATATPAPPAAAPAKAVSAERARSARLVEAQVEALDRAGVLASSKPADGRAAGGRAGGDLKRDARGLSVISNIPDIIVSNGALAVTAGDLNFFAFKDGVDLNGNGLLGLGRLQQADESKENRAFFEKYAARSSVVWSADKLRGEKGGGEAAARTLFLELAYWNPKVVTNEKGEAEVAIPLPDNMTTWKLRGRGTTAKTVVGDGSASFMAKRDFFVDLRLPSVVTEGNKVQFGASVHNLADRDREVELAVHSAISGPSLAGEQEARGERQEARDKRTETKKLTVKAHATERVWIEREIAEGETLRVEADAKEVPSEKLKVESLGKDKVVRSVPIRPWGIEVSQARGGTAHETVAVTLRLPEGRTYTNRSMAITVGPVIESALFDLPPMGFGGANTTPAARALAKAALIEYLSRTGERDTERYRTLLAELQQIAGQLVSSRRDEGDWAFAGNREGGDPHVSSLVLRALARAKGLGVSVSDETMAKAVVAVKNAYQKLGDAENAKKADLLYALSFVGEADFTFANRLYRLRNGLDSRSLALVTLTLVRLDRQPMAREVADVLVQKIKKSEVGPGKPESISWEADAKDFAWSSDPLEVTALAVLALERVGGFEQQVEKGVAWLLERKASGGSVHLSSVARRVPGLSAKGVAAMTEALADYYGKARMAADAWRLEIAVNDKVVRRLEVTGSTRTQTIEVPAAALTDQANRVDLRYDGRGEYAYSCVLSGFTRDFKTVEAAKPAYRVNRYYEPADLVYDGKKIPRGFGVARNYGFFRNEVKQLPAGEYTHVYVQFHPTYYPPARRYFMLTEPIPEGCTVLANSISGGFQHFEIGDGEITFYVGERDGGTDIHYDLYGHVPGQYKILPSQLRNAHDATDLFLSAPYDVAVLPAGEKSSDTYQMTPDEYYHLGLAVFAKKEFERANELLETLLAKWELDTAPYEKVYEALLAANVERGDANRIVKYFEIIYEKYPAKVLTFDQILRVASSYEKLREYERSYQVYRGMAESSFLKEANIAGELRKQGELLAAVDFLHNLIHTYPDLEVVQQSLYSLSQLVYATSNKVGEFPELKEKKIGREQLLRRTIVLLDEFLATYPENPKVEEAAFSMANVYLDLEASDEVVSLCQRFQKRYPRSSFLDGYQYVEAYGHFINGRHDEALALCRKVSTEKYPTPEGGMDFSDNRELAIYITGQIHHAQGKPVDAIAEYDRVKDKFADAREAIEYFKAKHLDLPEVAMYRTAETPRVDVTYRNVKQLDLRVFRVDLMKLYLTRRNLNNIADVDLAGIEPYQKKTVELGEGVDYMDKKTSVALELRDKGAFLVMAKGDELNRSAMILRGDLGLDVQEDAPSGRVRANVYKRASKAYLSKAHVKVIGEGNAEFVSGDTDLRGVFVADNVRGRVTVIARHGDEYAFYRGTLPLQNFVPTPPPMPAALQPPQQQQAGQQGQQRANLREQLQLWNERNIGVNAEFVTGKIMSNTTQGQEIGQVKF